jgi:hypothetical protein
MRVYLKEAELKTPAGQQLLELCLRMLADGKLDISEIRELRKWLRQNSDHCKVTAVSYLTDIMNRIAADGVIDRDELLELHLAIERVIPRAHREQALRARRSRERLRAREQSSRAASVPEQTPATLGAGRSEDPALFCIFKVRGVSFPNDDGTERQAVIRRCRAGEYLEIRRDLENSFSKNALGVFRQGGEQIGNVPEYVARDYAPLLDSGMDSAMVLLNVTGGTHDKPTCGVNVVMFVYATSVSQSALDEFAQQVLRLHAPHLRVSRRSELPPSGESLGFLRGLLSFLGLRRSS